MNLTQLIKIAACESESGNVTEIRALMRSLLLSAGATVATDEAGNLIAHHPQEVAHPVAIVAHLDTVHRVTGRGLSILRTGDLLLAVDPVSGKQSGIGGDDKCGLFCALELFRTLPGQVRVILTVDEEIGGIGAHALDLSHLDGCRYMLQADRRGGGDCVFRIGGQAIASRAFRRRVTPLLTPHGFSPCDHGGFTDVGVLSDRGAGISALNLSAGYHRPHTDSEVIDLRDLSRTLDLMRSIIAAVPEVMPFLPPPPPPLPPVPARSAPRWDHRSYRSSDWGICWACGIATVPLGETCARCSP
jgi:di/tripeptidase